MILKMVMYEDDLVIVVEGKEVSLESVTKWKDRIL